MKKDNQSNEVVNSNFNRKDNDSLPELKLDLPKKLEHLLDFKKISQRELARRLGITNATVSQWVKGINALSVNNIIKISKVLDVSPSYFFSDSTGKKTSAYEIADKIIDDLSVLMINFCDIEEEHFKFYKETQNALLDMILKRIKKDADFTKE